VSVSTYYVAAALVRFGSGVAIVDEFTARSVARQDLDLFTLSPALRFGIHAAWLEDRPLSKLGLQFVATVEDVLRSLPQLPRRA
jgi:DNA-binding transcriptional LysR family regulator